MAVHGEETTAGRLLQFRSEWPRHVSWDEVRAADSTAFRSAAQGAGLFVVVLLLLLLVFMLEMDVPAQITLPAWLDWGRGLFIVICLLLAFALGIWGMALISVPGDTRRGLAIARFASERDLIYSRFGHPPRRQGILLAEGTGKGSAPSVRHATEMPSLFRSGFALWGSSNSPVPSLQIAIASYSGSKSDPKAPRHAFRFLEMALPRKLPHIMIDARQNGVLRAVLPGTQRMRLEGDFDRHFAVYAPDGYQQDALQLLTPDVMACLIDHGRQWDIEIVDEHLVVASHRFRRSSDRDEYTALLVFSELIGAELGYQASYYTDPRAELPSSGIAPAGRRLRRVSAAWGIIPVILAAAFAFALPPLLSWFLDH